MCSRTASKNIGLLKKYSIGIPIFYRNPESGSERLLDSMPLQTAWEDMEEDMIADARKKKMYFFLYVGPGDSPTSFLIVGLASALKISWRQAIKGTS